MTEENRIRLWNGEICAFAISMAVLAVTGCGVAEQDAPGPVMTAGSHDDHGHGHAHPETLAEAITELKELRDTVRDAFAKNDEDAAHGPLHDVGHLLEDVNELAEKSALTAEQQATIRTSTDTLFDAFGAVDNTMHGKEGSTWDEVSGKIDAAIDAMAAAASGAAGNSAAEAEGDGAATPESPETESPETVSPE